MRLSAVGLIVSLTLCLLLVSVAADAQPAGPVRRIGWLRQGDPFPGAYDGFRQGLHDMGYVEGQNLVIELRSGKGHFEPLPRLAAELVGLPVEVLATTGIAATLKAKEATSTIPIVFIGIEDPLGHGLITSWAQPGGRFTGIANIGREFQIGKMVELIKEVVPTARRVAVLVNPDNPDYPLGRQAFATAAQAFQIDFPFIEVRDPATELDRAFAALTHERIDALYIAGDASFVPHRARIVELVAATRLPALYAYNLYVEAGGLMSYESDNVALNRRAGVMVGKLLNGTKLADIPAERPAKFRLTLNLKTAQALGITMPPSLLVLADEVSR
jgi:putative ABC transport system substrate-binding protein